AAVRGEHAKTPENPYGETQEAIRVMERMVAANAKDFRAYLIRASFRQSKVGQQNLTGAGEDLAKARDLEPDNAEVLRASARHESMLARDNGRIDSESPHLAQARAHLLRARKAHPQDTQILPQ